MITRRTALIAPALAATATSSACGAKNQELPGPQRAAAAIASATPEVNRRLESMGASLGAPVFIRAFKEDKVLELFVKQDGGNRFFLFQSWPICAATGKLGPKLAEGDKQVPEGVYGVTPQAMNNASSYHLSMNVGYPNQLDQSLGRTGSFIMIHGRCESIGCLAMTDPVIDQIWTLVSAAHAAGQAEVPVHLFPFHLGEQALADHRDSEHFAFWNDLAVVYEAFDRSGIPPTIAIEGGRYRVVT